MNIKPFYISGKAYMCILLDFADDKISGITFCYTFLNHENESRFQLNINKILELDSQGMTKNEAFKTVLGYDYDPEIF